MFAEPKELEAVIRNDGIVLLEGEPVPCVKGEMYDKEEGIFSFIVGGEAFLFPVENLGMAAALVNAVVNALK